MGLFDTVITKYQKQSQPKPNLRDPLGVSALIQGAVSKPLTPLQKLSTRDMSQDAISAAPPDPVQLQRQAVRDIPLVGPILGGTGGQFGPTYPEGSAAKLLVEEGVLGFLTENFRKVMNPTRTELAQRIDERIQKLTAQGEDPERALEAAVQDVIDRTPGTAKNISDLKNPETTLTEEEKEVLKFTNLLEGTFAALDAPIFFGSTKPVSLTLKSLDRLRSSVKSPTVSRQFIQDLTNQPDIKQAERDIIRKTLDEYALPETERTTLIEFIDYTRLGKSRKPNVDLEVEARDLADKYGISPEQPNPKLADALDDLISRDDKINVKDFSNRVQSQLLPLEVVPPVSNRVDDASNMTTARYENITLPDDLRGPVVSYGERVYQSPIRTSAGDVHFSGMAGNDNYFAHTRIEDLPAGEAAVDFYTSGGRIGNTGIRRVIEIQSDLFQKGRLEDEGPEGFNAAYQMTGASPDTQSSIVRNFVTPEMKAKRAAEIAKLEPYRNIWHERIIREEVKQAAIDGKTKLQFPTGETAMKIEGLGSQTDWLNADVGGLLKPNQLKVGLEIDSGSGSNWFITEVLGDGKFKAVPRNAFDDSSIEEALGVSSPDDAINVFLSEIKNSRNGVEGTSFSGTDVGHLQETFDISGKVDTSNPIYRFYEKEVGRYLKNKYKAELVTDERGVTWWQLNVDRALADRPVEAFAGGIAGIEEDEEGNIQLDPTKAFLGMAAAGFLGKGFIGRGKGSPREPGAQGDASSRPDQRVPQEKTPIPKRGQTEYPMSSPKLAESLSNEYKRTTGTSIEEAGTTLSPTNLNPKTLKQYSAFRKGLEKAWTTSVEFLQDDMRRVRNLVTDPNVKVTDDTDPYLAELLFHGRVGARLRDARDTVISIDQDIVRTARQHGVKDSEMTLLVNKYLHARHTPERNAKLGDRAAGLSDADAKEILSDIDALPYSGEVRRISDQIQTLNNQTLDVLLEAQVIDKELYTTLRQTYKNHVPLQRVLSDDEDIIEVMTSKGFDVRATGIKRAKGSEKQVADILANVVTNFEQAVIRAEKNRIDLATLQFARDNPSLGIFKEIKAKPIGKTFDDKVITERITDPTVLSLREQGKPVHLKITDEHLAMALKGVNRHQVPPMMKFIRAFTRLYSGLQTRFNPEFAFPNKIRDMQEAIVYAGSRAELGFKGGIRAALNQKAYKDVLDGIRGKSTEGAKLYQQMVNDGGTTGGMSLSTREAVELDLKQIRKLNRSAPRQAADALVRYIDNFNQVFEDSTRLAVYKAALDRGVSRKRAAEMAKEASVNFNKFGRGGPVINALYMFSNASIQGTTKMLRAMKNPKVAATVSATVGTAVYATGEWNDTVDPDWRDKVTTWDRLNALVVVLPSSEDKFNYAAIPVGWGIKPIKVSMEYAYDATQGKGDGILSALNGIGAAVINSYNPLGGTDTFSAVTPTILDLPSEINRNKAWHGGLIMPDWDKNAPDSIRYFSSLEDSTTGKIAVGVSEGLSGVGIEISPAAMNYAYEGYIGGAGRTATDFINTIITAGQGKLPDINDVPVASRFYRKRDNEEIGAGSKEYETLDKILEDQSRERFYLKKDAENAVQQLNSLSKEEARQRFFEIAERDPDLAEKIADIKKEEALGLTYTQRMTKELGVENGMRAQFLVDKFNSLETKEEKAELWQEYVEKKIITEAVAEQITYLLNNPQ